MKKGFLSIIYNGIIYVLRPNKVENKMFYYNIINDVDSCDTHESVYSGIGTTIKNYDFLSDTKNNGLGYLSMISTIKSKKPTLGPIINNNIKILPSWIIPTTKSNLVDLNTFNRNLLIKSFYVHLIYHNGERGYVIHSNNFINVINILNEEINGLDLRVEDFTPCSYTKWVCKSEHITCVIKDISDETISETHSFIYIKDE